MQECDRFDAWLEHIHRIESAELAAIGFHEPKLLRSERESAIAAAADSSQESIEAQRAHGRRLMSAIQTGNVLGDSVSDRLVS